MKSAVDRYAQVKSLHTVSMDSRSWLMDILSCINAISAVDFSLQDMYKFKNELQLKHTENHNIEAKIRQQLQILRDQGFIIFLGNGRYRKIL